MPPGYTDGSSDQRNIHYAPAHAERGPDVVVGGRVGLPPRDPDQPAGLPADRAETRDPGCRFRGARGLPGARSGRHHGVRRTQPAMVGATGADIRNGDPSPRLLRPAYARPRISTRHRDRGEPPVPDPRRPLRPTRSGRPAVLLPSTLGLCDRRRPGPRVRPPGRPRRRSPQHRRHRSPGVDRAGCGAAVSRLAGGWPLRCDGGLVRRRRPRQVRDLRRAAGLATAGDRRVAPPARGGLRRTVGIARGVPLAARLAAADATARRPPVRGTGFPSCARQYLGTRGGLAAPR